MCVSGGKECLLFGKFGLLCFLETLVLRFTLLPYYQRLHTRNSSIIMFRLLHIFFYFGGGRGRGLYVVLSSNVKLDKANSLKNISSSAD